MRSAAEIERRTAAASQNEDSPCSSLKALHSHKVQQRMSSKSMVKSSDLSSIMPGTCVRACMLADVPDDVFASAVGVHGAVYIAEVSQFV